MPENSAEMFDRVRLMARIDTDWDLSDKDTAALRHVLAAAEAREAGKVDNQRVKLEAQEECLRNAALFLRMTGFKNAETFSDLLESEADKVLAELEQVRPTNPTQPTAAEVIAGAEKALERLLPWALQAGANAEDALAICARWKEANGGK